jgi:hypothetical protein
MTRPTILLGAVALSFLFALAGPASAQHVITNPVPIRAGAPSSIRMQIARTTAAETPTRAMVGGERDIVPTGPIDITAAIGADASQQ